MTTQLIKTPVGTLSARWNLAGLYCCQFVRSASLRSADESGDAAEVLPGVEPGVGADTHFDWRQALQRAIDGYFETGCLSWDLARLDWSGVPSFHQVALRCCAEIPSGATETYGRLAIRAGSPKAARAVGVAMAKNRWPILIPCHRVVGAKGKLTGYSGTGGLSTKQRLLDLESRERLLFI